MNLAAAVSLLAVAGAQIPGIGAEPPAPQARIAFTVDERVHTIAADGTDRAPVTPAGTSAAAPAWSPDGTRLAYTALPGSPEDDEQPTEIRIVNADGSGDRLVAASASPASFVGEPAWSPDGTRIAFWRVRIGSRSIASSIVVADAAGGNEQTLRRRVARRSISYLHSPDWSPSGERILFALTRLDRRSFFRPELRSIASGGGDERLVARDAGPGVWSPDGSRIAYASVRDRNGENNCGSDECSYRSEIYVSDSDGANARRLTENPGHDANPAWSPDGRWIAFDSDRNFPEGERPEVYVMRQDGSCLTWLTNGTARSAEPAWHPDESASPDPGGCGDLGRPPLFETDLSPLRAARSFPVFWLGESFQNLMLASVSAEDSYLRLGYDDCASFDAAACPKAVELSVSSACSRFAGTFLLDYPGRLSRRRGALLSWHGADVGLHVHTGGALVEIVDHSESRGIPPELLRLVDSLRPLDGPAGGDLPRAALSSRVLRELRRIEVLHRRLGSVRAVHRRLRISQSAVRERLRFARRLSKLGGADRVRCR